MERILCPDKLNADPNNEEAEKEYNYWKKTFDNFISECGSRAPDKLRCLTKYVSASIYEYISETSTYEEAIKILENLYIKKKNEIFARFQLASRRQNPSETLDEFIQDLQKLSKKCNLQAVSAEEYRQELVRDTFINGLKSSTIRQRLLEYNTLSLKEAYDKAKALDFAQKNSETYTSLKLTAAFPNNQEKYPESNNAQFSPQDYDNTQANVASITKKKCWFCAGNIHSREKCPAKNSECSNCGKTGHWAKVCRSPSKQKVTSSATREESTSINAAIPDCLKTSKIIMEINGNKIPGIIDSASSDSYIDYNVACKLNIKINYQSSRISLASSSATTTVLGFCHISFKLGTEDYKNFKLGIMKDLCADVLLGIDFQKQHSAVKIIYKGDRNELTVSNDKTNMVCSLAKSNIKESSLFLNMEPNVTPITTKSRKFSLENKKFINDEIQKLLQEDIIEESNSPWRAQVVIVTDDMNRHKKRLCIDYSRTVNLYTQLDAYPLPKIDSIVNDLSKYEYFSTFDLKSAYHQISIPKTDMPLTAFEANGKLYQFKRIPFGVTNGVAVFQRAMDKLFEEENLKEIYPYMDNITVAGKTKEEHDVNVAKFIEIVKKKNLTLNHSKSILSTKCIKILGYQIEKDQIRPDPERLQPLQDYPLPQTDKSLQRALGMFAYYSKWIPNFSDIANPLYKSNKFPLDSKAEEAFKKLKDLLSKATLSSIDENCPFVVESDASDVAVSATLNQRGRPVAFMSRMLSGSEKHYHPVEKEATAVIEAIRKWSHLLCGKHFKIITDQRSVSFMFDSRKKTKVKNNKIQCWRLELAEFNYTIEYRPGHENVAADALTRAYCASSYQPN